MKKFVTAFVLFSILLTSDCFSQKSPSLKFTVGLAFPSNELDGELVTTNDSGVSFINSEFIKNNYAAGTGATLTGVLKFPIDKQGIVNGNFLGSYSYFNAFRRNFLGTTIENSFTVPVTFDSRFTASTFGLGFEITPLLNSTVSPFVSTNFTLNILSLTAIKNDFIYAFFNDAFRMGLLMNAGTEVKINSEYSFVLSGSYHMSNLFLKSGSENFNDRVEFNRENIPINDEQGKFYTSISNSNSLADLVSGSTKNVNWWNVNLGLNIVLGKSKKK